MFSDKAFKIFLCGKFDIFLVQILGNFTGVIHKNEFKAFTRGGGKALVLSRSKNKKM
jgi:hypothetical protein